MLTVELASLSEELIIAAIKVRMPPGWSLRYHQNEASRLWEASILDDTEAIQWEISDITLKQVLLHALGWLEVRNKTPDHRWVRRSGELTQDRVHELAYGVVSEEKDPPDLDPEEVSSVYSSSRK